MYRLNVPKEKLQSAEKIRGNALLISQALYYTQTEKGFLVAAGSGYVENHSSIAEVKTEKEAKDLILWLKNSLEWLLTS